MLLKDKEIDVIETICTEFNPLWDTFQYVETYYLKSSFKYQLIKCENFILYKEYFNETVINELSFEQDSIDWYILRKTNSAVCSYNELIDRINCDFPNLSSNIDVISIIEALKDENLIYISSDYSEIVSVIDTDLLL